MKGVPRGGKQKKLPRHPLEYCAEICLMTMLTLMKYSFNSRPNLKKGLREATLKVLMYLPT